MIRQITGLAMATLLSACGSMQSRDHPPADVGPDVKTSCESFFVYTMCMADTNRDGNVDYAWFADDNQIFMYRPGAALPATKPMHRCAMHMTEEVMLQGSRLLYGEDLNLIQEMDARRKLLVNYMAAREDLEKCYGGDSSTGSLDGQLADGDFLADEHDWDEEGDEEAGGE